MRQTIDEAILTNLIERAEKTGESLDDLVERKRQELRRRSIASDVKPDSRPK